MNKEKKFTAACGLAIASELDSRQIPTNDLMRDVFGIMADLYESREYHEKTLLLGQHAPYIALMDTYVCIYDSYTSGEISFGLIGSLSMDDIRTKLSTASKALTDFYEAYQEVVNGSPEDHQRLLDYILGSDEVFDSFYCWDIRMQASTPLHVESPRMVYLTYQATMDSSTVTGMRLFSNASVSLFEKELFDDAAKDTMTDFIQEFRLQNR